MEAKERRKGKRKVETIAIDDSDTEDEIAQISSAVKKSRVFEDNVIEAEAKEEPNLVSNPLAGLDRAQMEKDRLERVRKKRQEADLHENSDVEHRSSLIAPAVRLSVQQVMALNTRENDIHSSQFYWEGAIKKSFNEFTHQNPGTPFSKFLLPATPFNANGLREVVMATFCADIVWLAGLFPKAAPNQGPNITFICLEEGELGAGVHLPLHPDMPNWVRLVVPRTGLTEYTTMHMKFIMLFFEDRLRLMILSGNLVEYDWKTIENTAFVHDFPKMKRGEKDTTSEYGQQMKMVLQSLSVPQNHPAFRMMSSYNMNSRCEAKIVASVPTIKPMSGWDEVWKVGLGRLSKIVREIMRGKVKGGITLEAQGSSMGKYSARWLQQLHIVANGNKIEEVLPLPNGVRANKVWAQSTSQRESEKWPPIKLLFPSDRWVKTQSILGPDGARTFFGKSKEAVEKGFVDIGYQPVSVRGNIMMHHKALLALQNRNQSEIEKEDDRIIGWAYMGSHNLTQAAWGNISESKAGSEPRLIIRNWELGVVMPVRQADLDESQMKKESQRMAANVVTWQRPVERYRHGDIPWDQYNQ